MPISLLKEIDILNLKTSLNNIGYGLTDPYGNRRFYLIKLLYRLLLQLVSLINLFIIFTVFVYYFSLVLFSGELGREGRGGDGIS